MHDKMTIVKNTFDTVEKECIRSLTKKNLHSEPAKEEVLAQQLEKTFFNYGQTIAEQFQATYEKQNPALSFLFAQVSNAVVEKTFHHGSCHAQAAYSLIELSKKGIFNASLICSKTGSVLTEHWYLFILDEFTLKRLPQLAAESVYIRVNPKSLPPESLFFDTWSNQLCLYKNFKPQNQYTKQIKTTDQALFRPFLHLFKKEINVIDNIISCLNEYEKRLKQLPLNKEAIPEYITKLFTSTDIQFQNEIELLYDSEKCMSKLLSTIESYKKDFQEQLDLLKQNNMEFVEEYVQQKDKNLLKITSLFFKDQLPAQWKTYPPDRLVGKYVGHQVRFFTMQPNTSKEKAENFVTHLREKGFNAELKEANAKPSVLVDLTLSTN